MRSPKLLPRHSHSHSHSLPLSSSSRPIHRPRKILYLIVFFFLLYWFGVRHGLGRERLAPLPLGFSVPGGRRGRHSALIWDDKGLATVGPPRPGQAREHPIYELMERAEDKWNRVLASQSKTLEQAVVEYQTRYTLAPPSGFKEWFEFCQANDVRLVDEYDQLMKDLLPHHALSPEEFRRREDKIALADHQFTMTVTNAVCSLTGDRADQTRPKQMQSLVDSFRHALPEGFELRVTGSDHDTGSVILGSDQRTRAMDLARSGAYLTPDEIKQFEDPGRTPAWGWFKACPLDSPANIRPDSHKPTLERLPKSYIFDHLPTMDFCDYPELKRLHGAMWYDAYARSPSEFRPIMQLSKFPNDASFQMTALQGWSNISAADKERFGTWESKTKNKCFWRGTTTGGFGDDGSWRDSHRMRLHLMVNGPKSKERFWEQQSRDVMIPDGKGGFEVVRSWDKALGKAYTDIKLSGHPIQVCLQQSYMEKLMNRKCNPKTCEDIANSIEFGDYVTPRDALSYRYVLDVDGNGWSSRFYRLLTSGAPVIKFSMIPDWNMGNMGV